MQPWASLLSEVRVIVPIRQLHTLVTRCVPVVGEYIHRYRQRHKYMRYAQVLTRATGGRVTLDATLEVYLSYRVKLSADPRRTMVEKSHLSGDHGVELDNTRTQSTIREAFFTKKTQGLRQVFANAREQKNVCCASG